MKAKYDYFLFYDIDFNRAHQTEFKYILFFKGRLCMNKYELGRFKTLYSNTTFQLYILDAVISV